MKLYEFDLCHSGFSLPRIHVDQIRKPQTSLSTPRNRRHDEANQQVY